MAVVLDNRFDTQIDALLAVMTLEEKVGQLHQPPLLAREQELEELVRQGRAGAVVLAYTPLAGSEQRGAALALRRRLQRIAREESRLKIPLLLGRDVIHGHRTVFPIPLAQAAAWDEALVEKAACIAAAEARAEEVHWTFAPMMDVAHDPRWGRVVEGFGEDPLLTARMASAMVEGFQAGEGGLAIAACAKHFIAYGAAEGGRDYHTAEVSDYTLRNLYLPPFEAAVKAGVATVMASFNDVSGEAVTASHRLLTQLLKQELGFQGFVVSDWNAIEQLVGQGVAHNRREAARLAFMAGVDMDMASGCYAEHLSGLVADGSVPLARLDDAVRRVLRVKYACGLFEAVQPATQPDGAALRKKEACTLARAGMVLLQNRGSLLPLPAKGISVAVLGPMAAEARHPLGSWTLDGQPGDTVTLLAGMRETAPDAQLLVCPWDNPEQVRHCAQKADAIVVAVGEEWDSTGEARGSADLQLPQAQRDLLQTLATLGKPLAAVVYGGRPLLVAEAEACADAVLYAWHGGTMAGLAAAQILFGNANPRGRLPVSFLRTAGQVPLYYNHRAPARDADEYYHGPAGFKPYQDESGAPLHPFGFGLHYTAYRYGTPSLLWQGKNLVVSVDVENIGYRAGVETVQCYLSAQVSPYVRPVRALVGWTNVSLNPGANETVSITLDPEALAVAHPNGDRIVYPGHYTLWVGPDCQSSQSVEFAYTP